MSTKPVIADMQCKTYGTAHGLWQYDYGQILRIQGLNLPTAVEIHFSLRETGGESVTRVGATRDNVTDVVIPDSMLENGNITSDYYIYAFIYLTNESSGETTHKIRMKVQTRPRPEAFDTPEDAELFRGAIAAVNEAADRAGVSEENAAVSEQKTEEHLEAVDVLAKQAAENTAKVEELTQKTEMYADAVKRGVQADMSVNDENDPAYVKNRTHWIESGLVEILPETELTYDESDGCFFIMQAFDLEIGKTYVVNYNGTEYDCVAQDISFMGGNGSVGLGNLAMLQDSGDTGEPFFFGSVPEGGASMLIPFDGAASATISIKNECEIVHKLDNKYLDLDWLPTYIEQVIVPEKIGTNGDETTTYATRLEGFGKDILDLYDGREFIVYFDGVPYTTSVHLAGTGAEAMTLIGNLYHMNTSRPNTGEPFIGSVYKDYTLLMWADGAESHTISVCEIAVNKMPKEFLPESVVTQIEKNKNDISQLSGEIADLKENGISSVEPMEDDIPKVFIDGVIPTTKDDVLAEMRYVSKTEHFHAYLKIKCQGTTSMSFPKKNFTIKMYSDEERETKLKKTFKDWKFKQNKYVLKANWVDHSHARNIISANLWSEVVASRSDYDSLPTELKESPNNGAVDGFPIKVYTNGTYQGIYTWNIGKDDWMWNMDEDNPNHILMCAETNTDWNFAETPCNFRALWSGVNEEDWSIEVGSNSDTLKNSLNNLISLVKDTNDNTFKSTISNYLDVQSAIDYYIHQYVICGLDGLGKNMLMGTYDLAKWILGAYDMDGTFGMLFNGSQYVPSNYACPEDYQEKYNLLFERIEELFVTKLKERYFELRKTVYSYGNIINHFEKFMDTIGKDLYAEDLEPYPNIPSADTNNIKQIRKFVKERLFYCDTEFENMRSLSMLETDLLLNVNWEQGGYIEWNGTIVESSENNMYSDFIDVSSYVGRKIYTNLASLGDCRVVYYDSTNAFIKAEMLQDHIINVSSNVQYIRLSINKTRLKDVNYKLFLYVIADNLFNSTNIQEGSYNAETGAYEADATDYCNINISVTEGERYLCNALDSVFFFGSNGEILGKITDKLITFKSLLVPKGAVKLVAVTNDTNVTNDIVCVTTDYGIVGYKNLNKTEDSTVKNILLNTTWHNGYVEWNGVVNENSASDKYSDLIDISSCKGLNLYTNLFGVNDCRYVRHRADQTIIDANVLSAHPINLTQSNVEYIRLSLNTNRMSSVNNELYIYSVPTNLFNSTNIQDGGYNAETGAYEPNATDYCNIELSVASGETYLCNGLKSLFFFDASGNVLSKVTNETISFKTVEVPSSAVKMVAVATDTHVSNGVVCVSTDYTVIGYARVV